MKIVTIILLFLSATLCSAQDSVKTYKIDSIEIDGCKTLSKSNLKLILGMQQNELLDIPGSAISEAIKKLWETDLISDVFATYSFDKDKVNITFHIRETPRLNNVIVFGVSDVEAKDLLKIASRYRSKCFSKSNKKTLTDNMYNYMLSRGYYFIKQDTSTEYDSSNIYCDFKVRYNHKEVVRVKNLSIQNTSTTAIDLKKKRPIEFYNLSTPRTIFTPNINTNNIKIIRDYYLSKGHRDVQVTSNVAPDSIENKVSVSYHVHEGPIYRAGNIRFKGNKKHISDSLLSSINIGRGDVFVEQTLLDNLNLNRTGDDLSAKYMNDGHLLFKCSYEITAIYEDTVDLLIHIYEGPRVRISEINIFGNKKTRDHVIKRNIPDLPGDYFNRKNLFISRAQLGSLPYLDFEGINITPKLLADSTVSIDYHVKETTIRDRLFAAGGFGGSIGLIGTIGINLNNFSVRDIPKLKKWNSLPTGDGQLISIKAQTNATNFTSFGLNFSEPWIGGKKPNKLNFSSYYSRYSPDAFDGGFYKTSLVTLNYIHPFKKHFAWNVFGNYTRYNISNSDSVLCKTCISNKLMFGAGLIRNTLKRTFSPNYPTAGSRFSISLSLTLPHSILNSNIENLGNPERYKWVEYNKWSIDYEHYFTLITNKKNRDKKLTLGIGSYTGIIGYYNKNLGPSPFDRYILGGDGLSGFFSVLGSDFVRLRGYDNQSIKPSNEGGLIFQKFSTELRYPLIQNKKWAIYGIGFLEAGNTWNEINNTNLNLYTSGGAGFRFELNKSQVFGVDLAKGFRNINGCSNCNSWQPQFTFGFNLK